MGFKAFGVHLQRDLEDWRPRKLKVPLSSMPWRGEGADYTQCPGSKKSATQKVV